MVGEAAKVPWDQRLTERLVRQAWEAANDPARARRNPRLREQIRSPYFWVATFSGPAIIALCEAVRQGWAYAAGAVLFVVGLLAAARANRKSSQG